MLFICGYTTAMVAAAHTIASIALPPSRSTASADCAASACGATRDAVHGRDWIEHDQVDDSQRALRGLSASRASTAVAKFMAMTAANTVLHVPVC